jgi:beta-glucosidase
MKKLIISFSILLFSFFSFPQSLNEEEINNKVTELLSKMTIEEKVGQMTQITLQVVSKQQGTKDQTHILDEAKLEETIVKYNVGSILNVYDVWHSIDYWHEIITKVQDIATKKTRLGIPVIYGIDAIHGATYTQNSTLFPQAINMAATFNK